MTAPTAGQLNASVGLEPAEVDDPDLVREIIFGLRIDAWKSVGVLVDGAFPPDICYDEHDDHAAHWAIRDGGRLVGAARMCVHRTPADLPDEGLFMGMDIGAPPLASLNRLVVHPGYQRRGLSRALDQVRIRRARELGCGSVVCVAPPIRWESLRRQGFRAVAPVNLTAPPRWLAHINTTRPPDAPDIPRKVMLLPL